MAGGSDESLKDNLDMNLSSEMFSSIKGPRISEILLSYLGPVRKTIRSGLRISTSVLKTGKCTLVN